MRWKVASGFGTAALELPKPPHPQWDNHSTDPLLTRSQHQNQLLKNANVLKKVIRVTYSREVVFDLSRFSAQIEQLIFDIYSLDLCIHFALHFNKPELPQDVFQRAESTSQTSSSLSESVIKLAKKYLIKKSLELLMSKIFIPCQINQISETSPSQMFHFINIFFWRKTNINSDGRQNIKGHGWIFTE